jgi:hypothetical protein
MMSSSVSAVESSSDRDRADAGGVEGSHGIDGVSAVRPLDIWNTSSLWTLRRCCRGCGSDRSEFQGVSARHGCAHDHRAGRHESVPTEPLRVPLADGQTIDLLGECLFTVDGPDCSTAPVGIFVELGDDERSAVTSGCTRAGSAAQQARRRAKAPRRRGGRRLAAGREVMRALPASSRFSAPSLDP